MNRGRDGARAMGRRSKSRSAKSCQSFSSSSRCGSRGTEHHGTVKGWNVEKQFGFVSGDGNLPDAYMHAEGFKDSDLRI